MDWFVDACLLSSPAWASIIDSSQSTTTAKRRGAAQPGPLVVALGTACGAASRLLGPLVVLTHLLLGASRAASMALNFAAPVDLFADFAREHRGLRRTELLRPTTTAAVSSWIGLEGGLDDRATDSWLVESLQTGQDGGADGGEGGGSGSGRVQLVCMGGEWYRFPSSFFLPHDGLRLAFVRSHFRAQLPQPFRPGNGTWAPPLQVSQSVGGWFLCCCHGRV